MSDPEALRREMQTEAAEFVRRREVARASPAAGSGVAPPR